MTECKTLKLYLTQSRKGAKVKNNQTGFSGFKPFFAPLRLCERQRLISTPPPEGAGQSCTPIFMSN